MGNDKVQRRSVQWLCGTVGSTLYEGRSEPTLRATGAITLDIVRSLFNIADLAHGLGADFSGIDAMGARVAFSSGALPFGGVSVDVILNLSSGTLSYFGSPEAGLLAGASVVLVGGVTLFKNLKSNDQYPGNGCAIGIQGGDVIGINVERFWNGTKLFPNSKDAFQGTFIGVGGAVPGAGVYASGAYAIEILRVDEAGINYWPNLPSLADFMNDVSQFLPLLRR